MDDLRFHGPFNSTQAISSPQKGDMSGCVERNQFTFGKNFASNGTGAQSTELQVQKNAI